MKELKKYSLYLTNYHDQGKLDEAFEQEQEAIAAKPTENAQAYDLYLRALPLIQAMRPEQNLEALDLLHRAIELDPNYALALAHLAWAYEERLTRAWGDYGEDDKSMAIATARRAIAADRDDAMVLVLAGFVLIMIARDYDHGLQAVNRAREINPNIAFVSFISGACLVFCDAPEQGIPLLEAAIRVSPGDPNAFFFHASLALAHLCCARSASTPAGTRPGAFSPRPRLTSVAWTKRA